ncbi:hypothetical protein BH11MYX1_BH11MYX1_22300 [soil metagenome]
MRVAVAVLRSGWSLPTRCRLVADSGRIDRGAYPFVTVPRYEMFLNSGNTHTLFRAARTTLPDN